jgi:hypothetical protein
MKILIEVTRRELGTLLAEVKAQAGHESRRNMVTGTTEEGHSPAYYHTGAAHVLHSAPAEAVYSA